MEYFQKSFQKLLERTIGSSYFISSYYDFFIISHMIEDMSIKEEKKLIHYLFNSGSILSDFEKKVKDYYGRFL